MSKGKDTEGLFKLYEEGDLTSSNAESILKKNKKIINHKNEHGETLLILAVEKIDVEVVKLLLKYGADPRILGEKDTNDRSKSPIGIAIAGSNTNGEGPISHNKAILQELNKKRTKTESDNNKIRQIKDNLTKLYNKAEEYKEILDLLEDKRDYLNNTLGFKALKWSNQSLLGKGSYPYKFLALSVGKVAVILGANGETLQNDSSLNRKKQNTSLGRWFCKQACYMQGYTKKDLNDALSKRESPDTARNSTDSLPQTPKKKPTVAEPGVPVKPAIGKPTINKNGAQVFKRVPGNVQNALEKTILNDSHLMTNMENHQNYDKNKETPHAKVFEAQLEACISNRSADHSKA